MRQFQFDYHTDFTLKNELTKIRLWCDSSVYSHIVFQIYSENNDVEKLKTYVTLSAENCRMLNTSDAQQTAISSAVNIRAKRLA